MVQCQSPYDAMLTRNLDEFANAFRGLPLDFGPATPRCLFLVTPDGFTRASDSAKDNLYMAAQDAFDADLALAQHRELGRELTGEVPTVTFPGDARTPDAVFPNNVFATSAGRVIIGRMRHEVRQLEAERRDMRAFFEDILGLAAVDLSTQNHPCELTGSLVIDRARGVGFIGLSDRCDEEGARLMHEAFGLRASLIFDLAPGEYHTNVVLAILAGRAALICPRGFASLDVVETIGSLYAPHVVLCTDAEHDAFVGNCIAISENTVWMSARAADALAPHHASLLDTAGFRVRSVPLDAIEAGGGSLRCCIGEIY